MSGNELPSPPPAASVLVIEDEGLVAMLVEDMLHELGYAEVRHADSVEKALASIDAARPDIAILDANLRGIVAHEVARKLKESGIPFIVGTGFDVSKLPEAFRFGVPLRKPYSLEKLERALEDARAGTTRDSRS